jgi:hypothetical protein
MQTLRAKASSKIAYLPLGILIVVGCIFHSRTGDMHIAIHKTSLLTSKTALGKCVVQIVGGNIRENHYGDWPVCSNLIKETPIVYSFGIGGYDLEMVRLFNASVYCYDPTVTIDSKIETWKITR